MLYLEVERGRAPEKHATYSGQATDGAALPGACDTHAGPAAWRGAPALPMAACTSSASARQPASGPTAMMLNALGGQCACEVRPTVGRSAATPHSAAGTRTEPPPSMPGDTSSGSDHYLDQHSSLPADPS